MFIPLSFYLQDYPEKSRQRASGLVWMAFFYFPLFLFDYTSFQGFPGGAVVKNSPTKAGDVGSIPESERTPGEGNGNPLQYSCLENPMDGGAWWATVQGVTKSRT